METNYFYTDIFYEKYIFRMIGATPISMIYEVYPTVEIHPSDFYKEIIYNEKMKFIFTSMIGVPVMDMRGFVDYNEVKNIYKMTIEVFLRQIGDIIEDYNHYTSIKLTDTFNRIPIGGYELSIGLKYYRLEIDGDIYNDYIRNNIYMVDINIIGLDSNADLGVLYDDIIPRLEIDIKNLINDDASINMGFHKTFMIEPYSYIDEKLTLSLKIILTLDKIENYSILELSAKHCRIEKDIEGNLLPENYIKEMIGYLYNGDLIYIHDIFTENEIQYNGKNYLNIEFDSYLFTNSKHNKIDSLRSIVVGKKAMVIDEENLIYKSKNFFNNEIKYFGFMKDENLLEMKNLISKKKKFKNLQFKVVNMVDDLTSFTLIDKK